MFRSPHKLTLTFLLFALTSLILFQGAGYAATVTLQWDPNSESDLAGYNLYRSRSSGSGYSKVNSGLISSTSYIDDGILAGVSYYYVCTAVNTSGLESGYSNEVSYMSGPPNTPPVATSDNATTAPGTSVSVNVLANDQDPDGDPLHVTGVSGATHGSTSYTATSVIYTPVAGFVGNDSFSYTIADDRFGTATANVFILVDTVNRSPVAANDSATAAVNSLVYINVTANDSDPDGDSIQVNQVGSPTHGTTAILSSSSVRYTPAKDYSGSDSFTYTIGDGHGGSATATVSVTVTAANNPPTAANDSAGVQEDSTVVVNVTANDSDPDGDALTVSQVSSPSHGTASVESSASVRYTPAANYFGSDSFSYTISDGQGGTASATVTVTVNSVNDLPQAHNDSATTNEGQPVTISVLSNDSDADNDPLSVLSVGNPAHGTTVRNADQTVTYTPAANYFGSDSFSYTVSDGQGGTSNAVVTITVISSNKAPVAVDDTASTTIGRAVRIDVLANDSDPDGDPLTVKSLGNAPHGTLRIESDQTVSYTPKQNYKGGTDSFSYTVGDGQGATATARVTVTVGEAVNQPPVAVDDSAETQEDGSVLIKVTANDSDPDGDSLSVVSATQPGHGTRTIEGGGSIRYTPAADYFGTDSFSYTVSDGHGGTATATVSITVAAVNDLPVAVEDSAGVQQNSNVAIDVLSNDSDPDGDALSVVSVSQPAHGSVSIETGGTVRYTPATDYSGTDSFDYTISDGHGGTATATVTISVAEVGDASPVAVADTAAVQEDSSVVVNVTANDSDPDGDVLTVVSVTQPAHGTTAIEGTDSIRYTPAANYNGSDAFSYTISDGRSGTASANVSVSVAPVNDLPVAVGDSAEVQENSTVLVNVTANDSDVDGDALTVVSVTSPANGTATVEGSDAIRYTPATDYSGSDSFTYTVGDGQGGTATATVTVSVSSPLNTPPVAVDDTAAVDQNSSVMVNVTANDSDADGDVLTVVSVTTPANGTAAVEGSNAVRYTPATDYAGSDSFTYTISDGKGGTATAKVSVTVAETANTVPVAAGDSLTTAEDQAGSVNVIANDSDPDSDPLRVDSVTQPGHGTTVIQNSTTILYTPATDYFGSDSFSYFVTDGRGGSASATVSVTVTPVNDPPVPADDQASVMAGSSILIPVLTNDTDVDGDTLTVAQAGAAQHGQTAVEGTDQVRYTPETGFVGTDTFTYQVTDGQESLTAQVTVQVTEASQQTSGLVFPVSVDTGSSQYLAGTYVGVGLLNPGSAYEYVSVESHNRSGTQLSEQRLAKPLPPKGQTAFQTSELSMLTPDSISLKVAGDSGKLKGFFMVGDPNARRLDGVGGQLEVANSLYFPMIHEGPTESTLIQVMNPSTESSAFLSIELHRADGTLANKTYALVAPGGSFMGTATEIFGSRGSLSEGYVHMTSDVPLCGYEVVASQKNLSSGSGRKASATSRLVAPHFFIDADGGTSSLRILNAGAQAQDATVRVYDDAGEVMAEQPVTLGAGQLKLVSASTVFGLGNHKPGSLLAGSVELDVPGSAPIVATVDFSGFAGKSATSIPMVHDGYYETVFPQIAQTAGGDMFTGLAVLNPSNAPVSVQVQAYDPDGNLVATKDFDLAPRSRRVDTLASPTFFGASFDQIRGHLRIHSNGKVVSYAIFGDSHGEFLSTIEGQPAGD